MGVRPAGQPYRRMWLPVAAASAFLYRAAVEVIELDEMTPAAYEGLVDGEDDPWDTGALEVEWAPKTGHVGLVDDGALIGHAGWIVTTTVDGSGAERPVVGLGGVLLHRDRRGRGLGRVLVEGAMARMRTCGPPDGLLFCLPARARFYADMGWQPVDGAVTCEQPSGVITMPLTTRWVALGPDARPPTPPLHVAGLPF